MEVAKNMRVFLCLALVTAHWGNTAVQAAVSQSQIFFGQFQFADESLDIKVKEEEKKATLKIQRFGGRYGRVEVSWEMDGDLEGNVAGPHSGTVVFENGQDAAPLEVPLVDDGKPEALKMVLVRLTGASKGLLGEEVKRTATITLLLSDLFLGQFHIDPNASYIMLDEDVSEAKVRVMRRGEGKGRVMVKLAAVLPGERKSFVPDNVLVAENEMDFFFFPHEFTFDANQTESTFLVKIVLGRPQDKSIFIYIEEVRGLDVDNKDTHTGNEIDAAHSFVRLDVVYPVPEVARLAAAFRTPVNLTLALSAQNGAARFGGSCNAYNMAAAVATSFIVLLMRL